MMSQTISHYRILEELGRGGMGVVYKAEDTKLKRIVAIKLLPEDRSIDRQERERFTREAQAASALNHANICTIYEIDEAEGEIFIAMEFIEGSSLRTMIDGGSLPMAAAIRIARNVAEGLRAAHRKGIVHRDIKPENIIIPKEGGAKIADFGLAKGTDHPQGAGQASGTISYMAPEQLRGDMVTHLADIWSLGVVMYEMVTGRRPFTGEYAQSTMYAITNERQQRPSAVRPDCPSLFEKVIDRCLEKIPVNRYQDAGALIDDLCRIEDESKERKSKTAKSLAVLPFADISPEQDNKYFSDGLTEEIITSLSRLRGVRIISRASVMHYEREGKTMKEIAAELGVQYVLEGSVRKSGSDLRITTQLIDAGQDVYLWADNYRGTIEQIFDIQENVAARIVKALKMRLTPDEKRNLKRRATANTEAYQLYLKGRFFWNKRSTDGLLKAIQYFEEAIEQDPLYAPAWAGIADTYNLLGEYGTTSRKETYARARSAVQKALELDDRLAEAHTSLAFLIMLNEWDWSNSEKEFKRAISLNPNYPTAHHWYAQWLMFRGRIDEALQEASKAVELDPFSAAILKDKGLTLYYARDCDSAIEYARKTLELDQSFAPAHRLLSLSYLGKKMFAEAIDANERWMAMAGNEIEATIGLAQIYAAAGRRVEALVLVARLSPEQLSAGNFMRGLAVVHAALGDNDTAFAWLDKCYDARAEALCTLRIDPKIDGLRADPRFAALLKKVGLAD